jgi:hypothetical protein
MKTAEEIGREILARLRAQTARNRASADAPRTVGARHLATWDDRQAGNRSHVAHTAALSAAGARGHQTDSPGVSGYPLLSAFVKGCSTPAPRS